MRSSRARPFSSSSTYSRSGVRPRDPEIHGLNLRQLCQRIHNGVDGQPLRVPARGIPVRNCEENRRCNAVFYTDAAQCRAPPEWLCGPAGQRPLRGRSPPWRRRSAFAPAAASSAADRLLPPAPPAVARSRMSLAASTVATECYALPALQDPGSAWVRSRARHGMLERPSCRATQSGQWTPAPRVRAGGAQLRQERALQVLQPTVRRSACLEQRGLGADHAVLAAEGRPPAQR